MNRPAVIFLAWLAGSIYGVCAHWLTLWGQFALGVALNALVYVVVGAGDRWVARHRPDLTDIQDAA